MNYPRTGCRLRCSCFSRLSCASALCGRTGVLGSKSCGPRVRVRVFRTTHRYRLTSLKDSVKYLCNAPVEQSVMSDAMDAGSDAGTDGIAVEADSLTALADDARELADRLEDISEEDAEGEATDRAVSARNALKRLENAVEDARKDVDREVKRRGEPGDTLQGVGDDSVTIVESSQPYVVDADGLESMMIGASVDPDEAKSFKASTARDLLADAGISENDIRRVVGENRYSYLR